MVIQPLPLVSRIQWDDHDDELDGLRRVIVEIPVRRNGGREVSRICAVEGLGNGLCVGLVGAEREATSQNVTRNASQAASDDSEVEDDALAARREREAEKEKKRRLRLLDVKTEALAEFMREEFADFKMPQVPL